MLECYSDKQGMMKQPHKRGRDIPEQDMLEIVSLSGPSKKQKCYKPSVIQIDQDEHDHLNYGDIEQCPTIELRDNDMRNDPIDFFVKLEQLYSQYGAVKLVASAGWNPPFTFRNIKTNVTTRTQVLQSLSEGKPFEQHPNACTVKEYESKAHEFKARYKNKTGPVGKNPEELDESQFWNLVSNPRYKSLKTKVDYAADLPVSKYGSGFPLQGQSNVKDTKFEYVTNLWNLNNLYKSDLSMLKVIDLKNDKISGVTSPWVYMGMKFASFCWHVQDLFINSVNYNHFGSTKTWYIIPGQEKDKFDKYVELKYPKELQEKPDFLHRITLMIDPMELLANGIKVYKIRQNEKCYVVTFSKVYHAGFSHGFNVCEAVNFVSTISYPFIKEACKNYEKSEGKKMAIFPLEWIAYENYVNSHEYQRPPEHQAQIQFQYKSVLVEEYSYLKKILQAHKILEYSFYDKKNIRYDRNPCFVCKNYCYLNHLKCTKCRKNYCQYHLPQECCEADSFKLMMRQPNQDRKTVMGLLNKVTHVIE